MPLPLSGFPHLFDMILEAAPRESLLSLRGVCRSFKARVDAHMLHHIVVFASIVAQNDMFIHAPSGDRIPCTMEWNLAHPERAHRRRVDTEEGKPHLVTIRQRLQAVRILDIRGWTSHRTEYVLKRLRLQVLRIIADLDYEIKDEASRLAIEYSVNFGAFDSYSYSYGWIPSNTRHAVVVVDYDIQCQWYPDEPLPKKVEELTVIFKPRDNPYDSVEVLGPELTFMKLFGSYVLSEITRVKITLVGMLNVPLELLGLDPDQISSLNFRADGRRRTRKSIVRRILSKTAKECRGDNDEATTVAAVRDNISFMTMENYQHGVGDEMFALTTMPSVRSGDMLAEMPSID